MGIISLWFVRRKQRRGYLLFLMFSNYVYKSLRRYLPSGELYMHGSQIYGDDVYAQTSS